MYSSAILVMALAVATAAQPIDRCRPDYKQQLSEITRTISRFRFDNRHVTSKTTYCSLLRDKLADDVRRHRYAELGLDRAAKESLLAKITVEIENKIDCLPQMDSGLRSLVVSMRDCDDVVGPEVGASKIGAENHAGLAAELEATREQLGGQKNTVEELKRANAEIESKLQSKTSEGSELKAELEAKEVELAQRSGELARSEKRAQDLRATLFGKSKAHEESLAELATRDEAIGKLKAYVESLEANLKSTSNANKANEFEVATKAGQVDKLRGELAVLKSSLESKTGAGGEQIEVIRIKRNSSGKLGATFAGFLDGAFLTQVDAGSAAAQAGLRFGDQIVAIDGKPVAAYTLPEVVALVRDESTYFVRRSPFARTFVVKRQGGAFGFRLGDQGIESMVRDSPAARAGMLSGFTIISVNDRSVIGLPYAELSSYLAKQTELETRLTVLPTRVYVALLDGLDKNQVRTENNKIADDEKNRK